MKYRIYRNENGKYKIKCKYGWFLWLDLQETIEPIRRKGRGGPAMRTVLFDTLVEARGRIEQEKNKEIDQVKSDKWSYVGD